MESKRLTDETEFIRESREYIEANLEELKKQEYLRRMLNSTVRMNFFIWILRILFYYCIYIPIFALSNPFFFRLKIINKKYFRQAKKSGGVLICNHVHMFDNSFCALAAFPKKLVFTSHRPNFHLRGAAGYLKALGVVPTPKNYIETKIFFYVLGEMLRRKKFVHIYPEGELKPYDAKLRQFQKGAFHLAVSSGKPLLPMRIVYRPRKNPNKKPRMTLIVCEPLYPDPSLDLYSAVDELKLRAEQAMSATGL